jgi:peroxiredoxin
MNAKETPSIEIGSTMPDFQLPASTGKSVDVREYRERSILVLFFVREFN